MQILLMALVGLTVACSEPEPPAAAKQRNLSPVRVAVASNMVPVFEKVAADFMAESHLQVVASSGASGVLAEQIRNGAPTDLLISADTKRVLQLRQQGFIIPESYRIYAVGVLVLARPGNGTGQWEGLAPLKSLPNGARIALPNPETAPYGAAALAALKAEGLEKELEPTLITAENVGQARQYLLAGNVQYAFLPLSLVDPKKMDFAVVPESLHEPIEQALGVVKSGKNIEGAEAFAKYLTGPKGQERLREAGYKLPGS